MEDEKKALAACEAFVAKLKTEDATLETVEEALALSDLCADAGLGYGAWDLDARPLVTCAASLLFVSLETGREEAKEAVGFLLDVFINPTLDR